MPSHALFLLRYYSYFQLFTVLQNMFTMLVKDQQITKINCFNLLSNCCSFHISKINILKTKQMKCKDNLIKQWHLNAAICNFHVLSYWFNQLMKKQNVHKFSFTEKTRLSPMHNACGCDTTCNALQIDPISFRWQDNRRQTDKLGQKP